MGRVKLTISYDGTNFLGYQVQAQGRTVEGEIGKALLRMNKEPVDTTAAGRTDSGVHASGQVISFSSELTRLPESQFIKAINNFFPPDIRARDLEYVGDAFNARKDARARVYKYYVHPSNVQSPFHGLYSLRLSYKPNVRVLNELARAFVGTHDFSTFSAPNDQVPNRERTIYSASWHIEGSYLVFRVSGLSFLWRMVRSLVGSMLEFETKAISLTEVSERLKAKDRELAGATAPACGLYLHEVTYVDEPILF